MDVLAAPVTGPRRGALGGVAVGVRERRAAAGEAVHVGGVGGGVAQVAHDAAVHAVGHEEDDVGGHGGFRMRLVARGWVYTLRGWGGGGVGEKGRRKWTPQVGWGAEGCVVRHGLPRTPDRLTTNGEGLAGGLVFGGFEDAVG